MAVNGLNYSSGNTLTFTTDSVKRGVINNVGQFGFGVLTPTNQVHISGATDPVKIEGLSTKSDARILAVDANGVMSYRDDVLVNSSILNNVITLESTGSGTTELTVQAITAVTYNNNAIALQGTGTIGSTPIALPFVTGGTYNEGVITLGINGASGESNIQITGVNADDTFVTGATFNEGTATLTRNDGGSIQIEGIWTSIPNQALANSSVTIGSTSINLGSTSTTLAGLTSVSATTFTGNLTGKADSAVKLETARNFSIIGGQISATAVSFDGTANVQLSATIDNSAVTADKLATNSVTTVKILDANVTEAKLATDSVITAKIQNGAVTTEKIADSSVTDVKLATDSVTTVKILDANVTTAKIADNNVTTAKIADNNVTTAKIADANVTAAKLATDSVTTAKIENGAITTLKITDAAVTNDKLENSNIAFSDGSNDTGIELGDTFTISGGTGINSTVDTGIVTLAIDSSVVTLNGTQTLTNKTINGSQLVNSSVTNAKLQNSSFSIIGNSGTTETISLGDTLTISGSAGIDFIGVATDKMDVILDESVVQFKSEKGVADGYASLDANGKIPANQLPSSVFNFLGTWSASTNTPTLVNGTGTAGDVYRVVTDGTVNFGAGNIEFTIGDLVLYDGAEWQRVDGADAVESVNGQTGVVVLDADDISDSGTTNQWDKIVSLDGDGINITGTYPSFTLNNSDKGSSQNIFKTFNVPSGSAVVADTNNDSLTFTSTDSSIIISGSGKNIDVTVAAEVNTNIYNTNGTLSGNRTVTQNNHSLSFTGGDFSVNGVTFNVDDSANAVSIGVATPDASAVLEIASTSKGFLFPRMTETQRNGISSAATGLMVYQTDGDEGVYIHKSFGWVQVI